MFHSFEIKQTFPVIDTFFDSLTSLTQEFKAEFPKNEGRASQLLHPGLGLLWVSAEGESSFSH